MAAVHGSGGILSCSELWGGYAINGDDLRRYC